MRARETYHKTSCLVDQLDLARRLDGCDPTDADEPFGDRKGDDTGDLTEDGEDGGDEGDGEAEGGEEGGEDDGDRLAEREEGKDGDGELEVCGAMWE